MCFTHRKPSITRHWFGKGYVAKAIKLCRWMLRVASCVLDLTPEHTQGGNPDQSILLLTINYSQGCHRNQKKRKRGHYSKLSSTCLVVLALVCNHLLLLSIEICWCALFKYMMDFALWNTLLQCQVGTFLKSPSSIPLRTTKTEAVSRNFDHHVLFVIKTIHHHWHDWLSKPWYAMS